MTKLQINREVDLANKILKESFSVFGEAAAKSAESIPVPTLRAIAARVIAFRAAEAEVVQFTAENKNRTEDELVGYLRIFLKMDFIFKGKASAQYFNTLGK
jgi:hypothetical protein